MTLQTESDSVSENVRVYRPALGTGTSMYRTVHDIPVDLLDLDLDHLPLQSLLDLEIYRSI